MKTIEQRMAEALVECGHASIYEIDQREHLQHNPPIALIIHDQDGKVSRVTCDPFADTLEGRRQADALEDWLAQEKTELWMISEDSYQDNSIHHQWRLDRIKWCLEELIGEKDAD